MFQRIGVGTLVMVPQTVASLYCSETRVPGGKGSGVGSERFRTKPHDNPLSKRMLFGKQVIGKHPSSSLYIAGLYSIAC